MKRAVSSALDRLPPWVGSFCVFLILLGIAFRSAWLASHDLAWPYDYDLFRDAAFAQTIIHGNFPADAYYAGEQNWYNPLGPAVIGGIARLFALEPIEAYAHHGAIIALAVPLAIFVLAVTLFGRWAGLASLFAFLFLGPNDLPSWAAPSYSPWLFANLLSLVPFALTVTAALRAGQTGQPRIWAACGVLLGVTFLTHTAAAMVAGPIALVLAWERGKTSTVALRWGLVLVPALLVSAPFLATILGHYGLQIKNTGPQDFIWDETDLHRITELLLGALNVRNAIALLGFVLLFRNPAMRAARSALITWLAVCVVMLAHGYARQAWPDAHLPGIVPPFHWLFHLRLARALLLGYGLYCAVDAATSLLARWRKIPAPIALLVTLSILLLFQTRSFARRFDFEQARNLSLQYAAVPGFAETIAWLRRETPSDAVVLASSHDALIILGAAARKTVVIDRNFSNPYVPFEPRASAAADMGVSLANHDRENFLTTAAKYSVSYVLLDDASPAFADQCLTAPFVALVFARGHYAVLRVAR
ncbi:MAG: hypothetical protein QOC70_1745 [Verrucomicrobiota bacterium]|jgi:hypothetical protein